MNEWFKANNRTLCFHKTKICFNLNIGYENKTTEAGTAKFFDPQIDNQIIKTIIIINHDNYY
jgi:hypothetical protein